MRRAPDIDVLITEWGIQKRSLKFRSCMRRVLGELSVEALLTLRDQRLQVAVLSEAPDSAWAYFPMDAVARLEWPSIHRSYIEESGAATTWE
jgi:hypothetical protein